MPGRLLARLPLPGTVAGRDGELSHEAGEDVIALISPGITHAGRASRGC
jgi:hypothetical protein